MRYRTSWRAVRRLTEMNAPATRWRWDRAAKLTLVDPRGGRWNVHLGPQGWSMERGDS